MPFLPVGTDILKAVPKGLLALQGAEISFLILPFIINRKSTVKAAFKVTALISFLYGFIVFICIYLLGWELTSKVKYPLLFLFELIQISVLPDFKAVFILIWSISILLSLAIEQFIFCYNFSKVFKISYKKSFIVLIPILFILSIVTVYNTWFRESIVNKSTTYFASILMIWAITTFILAVIKKKGDGK